MDTIAITNIAIPEHHRAIKPWHLAHLAEKIEQDGFNTSYPITIEEDGTLVDGRHRLEAAKANGIAELPYTLKPDGVSVIRHSLRCNADGQDCQEDDVFDLAELCWYLSQNGKGRKDIATEIGLGSNAQVTQYTNIKNKLHPSAWELARYRVTKNDNLVIPIEGDTVTQEVTKVTWLETYFRALLKHLPYEDGDHATMRAQVKAIRACIARANEPDKRSTYEKKQVTAHWIGILAKKLAWHVELAKYMRDNLVERVPLRDRVDLLKNIYQNVYGEKPDDKNRAKFYTAVAALNEKVLGVVLYCDNALQCLPLIEDGSVALVVTDPPYNVTENEWDKIGTDEEYLYFTRQWLTSLRPKLADDYHLFFFCDPDYAARIEVILADDEWPLLSRIIWWNRSVTEGRPATSRFARTWQMIFHCGTHALNWSPEWSDERFDIQEVSAPNANTADGGWHPTPKPLKLIKHLVQIGSKPTDIVLDLFAGGGTTGEACSKIRQRQCILIENNDEFCTKIEKRLGIQRVKES